MSISKESLQKLYLTLDKEMRDSFDRSLPFEEYIFDRFEKAKSIKAGEGSSVHHSCYIYGTPEIGANTWIGPFTLLDASGGLKIGDNCSVSSGVHIYSHDSVERRLSGGEMPLQRDSVEIGHSCYIGPQSVIARGVQLGNFCIVGCNSFVAESFPANSVIMGTPAKLKGRVCLNEDKSVHIEWIPNSGTEAQIEQLEKKIRDLEQRMSNIEKV